MTELQLYKFTQEAIELRWEGEQLLMWLSHYELEDFANILRREDADDGGLDCVLQTSDGTATVVLDLVPICEEECIEPENILRKEDSA